MKIAAFIDGANLYSASKALAMDIDYARVLKYLNSRGHLVRAFYYTALLDDEGAISPLRPLVDWLGYNGYAVVTKKAKEYTEDGRRKVKGSMGMDMVADIMEMADRVDHIFIFSGDGDFRRAIKAVQRKGVRVTVVSTLHMTADEIRRQADEFIELEKIDITKTQPMEKTNEKLIITSSRRRAAGGLRNDETTYEPRTDQHLTKR